MEPVGTQRREEEGGLQEDSQGHLQGWTGGHGAKSVSRALPTFSGSHPAAQASQCCPRVEDSV